MNFNMLMASRQDYNNLKNENQVVIYRNDKLEMQVINFLYLRDNSGFSRDFVGFHL